VGSKRENIIFQVTGTGKFQEELLEIPEGDLGENHRENHIYKIYIYKILNIYTVTKMQNIKDK
jgi:hypothetical protein